MVVKLEEVVVVTKLRKKRRMKKIFNTVTFVLLTFNVIAQEARTEYEKTHFGIRLETFALKLLFSRMNGG